MIINKKLNRISTNLDLYKAVEHLLKTKKHIRQDGIWKNDYYMRLFVRKRGENDQYIDVRIVSMSEAHKSLGKSFREKLKLAKVLAEDAEVQNYQRLNTLELLRKDMPKKVQEEATSSSTGADTGTVLYSVLLPYAVLD